MMALKLSHKIFIISLGIAGLVVLLMIALIWFYFSSNFSEYSNRIILERYQPVVSGLIQEYRTQGHWQALQTQPEKWRELLSNNLLSQQDRPKDYAALVKFKSQRLAVFDAEQQHIIGGITSKRAAYTLDEICDQEETIGWIGLHKNNYLSNPMAKAFLIQQLHGLAYIGGGILLLASLVTFFFSRHMLQPLKALTTGTQALASRQFDTQIPIQSQDEIGQLAKNFNDMAKTLKQYEDMRQQWISDIAHELRTPLLILSGEIEALKDGVRMIKPDTLESLYAEAQHLGKIVNDLHELSLADSGGLHCQQVPTDVIQVLKNTLAVFQPQFTARQINLQQHLPQTSLPMLGDDTRLKQLFSNLLQNAVKYMHSPGTLTISAQQQAQHMLIVLEDSGPGVPTADLPLLFERLHRVEKSRNRQYGGSGLGLSICKSIVESFAGSIIAKQGQAGGLSIEIQFPQLTADAVDTSP